MSSSSVRSGSSPGARETRRPAELLSMPSSCTAGFPAPAWSFLPKRGRRAKGQFGPCPAGTCLAQPVIGKRHPGRMALCGGATMSHPFGGLYGDDSPQAETGSEGHLAGDFLAHGGDLAGHAWSDDLAGHLPGDGHLPDGLHDVAGDQQWDPGTDPGTAPGTDPGHPLVYPPAVPQEYQGQDSADPILSIYDSVDSGMASEASQIWGYAHPGEAWPYDGSVPE